jgi:transketolase
MAWPGEPFHVSAEGLALFRECVGRGERLASEWDERLGAYRAACADLARELDDRLAGRIQVDWDTVLPRFGSGDAMATRQASARTLQALARAVPALAGGSADLASSTGVAIDDRVFTAAMSGRSIAWGVREHAMAAAMNGMAAHGGIRPYGSTFLVFADYMKPAIRLAGIMGLPVIYVFSHDSIGVGEDGPTHQPIEHLAMLRGIPNLTVIRPADAAETAEAWRLALERADGPTALILTRQKVPGIERGQPGAALARRGGYVIFEPPTQPAAIVIGTGSETQLALAAARAATESGIPTRAVSLPSWEVFRREPPAYREDVLPAALTARVSVEAASTFGWHAWVTDAGEPLGIDHFGASAPGERLFRELGFTVDLVAAAIRRVHGRPV